MEDADDVIEIVRELHGKNIFELHSHTCPVSIMNRENGLSQSSNKKRPVASYNTLLMVLAASALSFLAGTQFAFSFNQCSSLSSPQKLAADASKGQSEPITAELPLRKEREGRMA